LLFSSWIGACVLGRTNKHWCKRTLVVGPSQPVDGDSVSCTKALVTHLRKLGWEAYTLPTRVMYRQLAWILEKADLHAASQTAADPQFTTDDMQAAYDALHSVWRPDEIVLVDGPLDNLGFDPRGVKVFVIDHHIVGGVTRDDDSAYIQPAPSAGCLLIDRFKIYDPILAVSILTDTYWLRQNQPAKAAAYLAILAKNGLTDELLIDIQEKIKERKDPQILLALKEADLRVSGDAAFAVLKTADAEIHRGVMGELGFFSKHQCVVRADGYTSFKTSDRTLDLRPLATKYGAGGHATVAAGRLTAVNPEVIENLFRDFLNTVRQPTV
jgi:nanoRNase/pAp phosphatase (c-di-AMP/oligoRNAs hydrolase)